MGTRTRPLTREQSDRRGEKSAAGHYDPDKDRPEVKSSPDRQSRGSVITMG